MKKDISQIPHINLISDPSARIEDLINDWHDNLKQMENLLDSVEAENRSMTDEENALWKMFKIQETRLRSAIIQHKRSHINNLKETFLKNIN